MPWFGASHAILATSICAIRRSHDGGCASTCTHVQMIRAPLVGIWLTHRETPRSDYTLARSARGCAWTWSCAAALSTLSSTSCALSTMRLRVGGKASAAWFPHYTRRQLCITTTYSMLGQRSRPMSSLTRADELVGARGMHPTNSQAAGRPAATSRVHTRDRDV